MSATKKNVPKRNYCFDRKTKRIDVYDLINSKDIAEHCRSIRHEFDTIETAVIIHRSDKLTLAEKIECFNILIEHYDDMEVLKRPNCKHYDSVKTLLAKRIGYINKATEIFENDEEKNLYSVGILNLYYGSNDTYSDFDDNSFSSLDNAKKYLRMEMERHKDYDNITGECRIRKRWIDDKQQYRFICFELDKHGRYKDFHYSSIFDVKRKPGLYPMPEIDALDGIWINIPTPFKKGDILKGSGQHGVGVLEWLCNQDEEYVGRHLQHDESDMTAYHYFLDDKGEIFYECMHNYDYLEYYRDPLEGKYRLLKPISLFLKGEIRVDLFLHAIDVIRAQEEAAKSPDWPFTSEALELVGLKPERKD